MRSSTLRLPALFAIVLVLVLPLAGVTAWAKEYVLVGSYGNQLHLIDPLSMRVEKSIRIPGPGTGPTEIVASPDGRIAYALTNRWKTVSGMDLGTGAEVFRAELAVGDVQVHALFGLDVSPDGKELYVVEQRTRARPDRFEVLDPAIAVYKTSAGTAAQPDRLIPIKRQIQHLAVSTDGRTIYAHGLDIYAIDVLTGALRGTIPVANWQRPGYGPADSMAWLGEQLNASAVYAMPFYAERVSGSASPAALAETQPQAAQLQVAAPRDLGVLVVDLRTGASSFDIVGREEEAPGLTGMTANPKNPNEVIAIGGEIVKIDRAAKRVVAHAPTGGLFFYVVTASADGERLYTGGGHCRVGIFTTKDLKLQGVVELPNCAVMGQSSLRVVNR